MASFSGNVVPQSQGDSDLEESDDDKGHLENDSEAGSSDDTSEEEEEEEEGSPSSPSLSDNGVVLSLRRCETMNRLVFVSCDPSNAIRNFISLARPQSKQYKGEFFIPVRAIPIDLFPHTPHFELVILFERWDELRWKHIMEGNPLPQDEEYFQRLPDKPNFTENDSEKSKRAPEEQDDDTRKKMKPE